MVTIVLGGRLLPIGLGRVFDDVTFTGLAMLVVLPGVGGLNSETVDWRLRFLLQGIF